MKNYEAIDIMSLLLDDKAYQIWLAIHHPHEPSLGEIEKLGERLNKEQKMQVTDKARMLKRFAQALTDQAAGIEKALSPMVPQTHR